MPTQVFERDSVRNLDTVITFLEMTERPKRPKRPAPMRKLALLRAGKPPVSFYLWLYRTVGADWHWTDRLAWPQERLVGTIHDPGVEIHVLHVDGVPAGFAELDFRREGVADLALFGMLPEFTGQGLGGYLLDQVIDMMWRPGIERAAVDTNTRDHPRALAMYQKAGFQVVRRQDSWLVPNEHFSGETTGAAAAIDPGRRAPDTSRT